MKKYILLYCVILFGQLGFSQLTEVPLGSGEPLQERYYYKDVFGVLDPFVGTYVYTSNDTIFKVVLQKKLMSSRNNNSFYEDLLIGGYQLTVNNTDVINTLNEISNSYTEGGLYPIHGNMFYVGNYFQESNEDYGDNEVWLDLSIKDTSNGDWADLTIRRATVNGQEVIKIYMYGSVQGSFIDSPDDFVPYKLPVMQDLVLVKQ
ncbi:hypothetical protein NBRC110019_25680 [Neptunitalea chrysea]|uniref:DUF6705 domain-containing protein n=1 Tax=Neptunitalea chrysea TaxID=1647581 RepID=A0A9W6EW85_9FLAO|nr:DUF6705 family protein [Neptunitalea chrysea]GLB53527.1 hypothetical protein NBRC110019_25680 [Neptunitalea chrysea]